MAGRKVTRLELDGAMADTLVSIRVAVDKLTTINEFLVTVPISADGVDPLTVSAQFTDKMDPTSAPGVFGYTEDEAKLIRDIFGKLLGAGATLAPVLKNGRKLTGLA